MVGKFETIQAFTKQPSNAFKHPFYCPAWLLTSKASRYRKNWASLAHLSYCKSITALRKAWRLDWSYRGFVITNILKLKVHQPQLELELSICVVASLGSYEAMYILYFKKNVIYNIHKYNIDCRYTWDKCIVTVVMHRLRSCAIMFVAV